MSEEFKMQSHIHTNRYISAAQRDIDGIGSVARIIASNGYNDCTVYLDVDQLVELGNQLIELSKDLMDESDKITLKAVYYRGRVAQVPVDINWLATDQDGCMWGYKNKPEQGDVEWLIEINNSVVCIGSLCCYDAYWENSLKEV